LQLKAEIPNMTTDETLAAILATVQTDPGHRGLSTVAGNNLFTACPDDFAATCRSIALSEKAALVVATGFYIPTADPPAYETDGPLGAVFLKRHLEPLGIDVDLDGPGSELIQIMRSALSNDTPPFENHRERKQHTHEIWLECAGPAADGNCYSMRGRNVTPYCLEWIHQRLHKPKLQGLRQPIRIGIGDGGNEIGMGKIPHETVVANIPNGDLIHCRVPSDYLIVAGVSNWGAYAIAAGVYLLRGVTPPDNLFDPKHEREILEVLVREGRLVDGVTGKQTATVDGLTWEEYAKPLIRIREILKSH
jgi:hypothetical protein